MSKKKPIGMILSGLGAGTVNGLFGAGGGMVLVPLLNHLTDLEEDEVFPSSISIILPVCLVSLGVSALHAPLPFAQAAPYLSGSAIGGILAGILGKRIPTLWLHRILGAFVLWGGVRYLC